MEPDDLLKQLAAHRRTLAQQLEQRAKFGAGFVPPQIDHSIADARDEISHIKTTLRQQGVAVDDHPADAPATATHRRNNRQRADERISIVISWTALALAGNMVGYAVSRTLRQTEFFNLAPFDSFGDGFVNAFARGFYGLIYSAIFGLVQLVLLRSILPRRLLIRWIIATVLGYSLASFFIGLIFQAQTFSNDLVTWPLVWLILGLSQHTVLKRAGYRAPLWMFASALGGLGRAYGDLIGASLAKGGLAQLTDWPLIDRLGSLDGPLGHVVVGVVAGGLIGLLYGISTGILLAQRVVSDDV